MKIAFLNLCHTDPNVVGRVARRLTSYPGFDMYLHIDKKSDEDAFRGNLEGVSNVYFVKNRKNVSWGGYQAIEATLELIKMALASGKKYDYFMLLQNLDYPIKSELEIDAFFKKNQGKQFIRACNISKSKDWHFQEKYKLYHNFDSDFYLRKHCKIVKISHDIYKIIRSIPTLKFNGVIQEGKEQFPVYYGSAQWALTEPCIRYVLEFVKKHPVFCETMRHIKFPDEEFFQTIVHNSPWENTCSHTEEKEKRWLVNWRNLHYYEYPKEIKVFTKEDFGMLQEREELFCRKVRSGISDELMDCLDNAARSSVWKK